MSVGSYASLVIAVPSAVIGSASFGLASAVQQRATKQVPEVHTLNPRLLLELVRKPMWIASIGTVVLGLSLQVVALAFGPLLLVQPLLVTSVLFAALFASWMGRRHVDGLVLLGGLCCAAGLSAFLLLGRPHGSGEAFIDTRAIPLGVILVVLLGLCLLAAQANHGKVRVLGLALATGVLYGVTAALMKVVATEVRVEGLAGPFQNWVLYAVCLIGPSGFLLSQNTFQQGTLISPALAVITTVDPLVGVAIGVSWFSEQMVVNSAVLAGEAIGALVLVGGIVLLTERGERLRQLERSDGSDSERGYTWG